MTFGKFHPLIFLVIVSGSINGRTAEPTQSNKLGQLWDHATLYEDDRNPILKKFKLRGRYQGQYWHVERNQDRQSDWEDRRLNLGFDARLLENQLEIRAEFQSNDGFRDFYDGLLDAYVRWKPNSALSITVGKTKPLIGQFDWLESTNTQPTFERSQIFNQLGVNRATALTLQGAHDALSWRAGVYANDTPSSTGGSGAFGDGEFGNLNGGTSFTLGGGYDLKQPLGLDQAAFQLDWLHSERETDDWVLNRYQNIFATTFWMAQENFEAVFEAYYALGGDGDRSDVFGCFILSTYEIIPKKIQLVGRYSYANSEGPLGVVAQRRYESANATLESRGDSYHAIYGGAQYFIHGDSLKLMAGAEYARLENERGSPDDGWTLLTGIRLSF